MTSLTTCIAANILDALPLDLKDGNTDTELSRSPNIRLNKWVRVRVETRRIRLNLLGMLQASGGKASRTYNISTKGTIPKTFWTVVREHTEYNIRKGIREVERRDRIKAGWPIVKEYIDALGFKDDKWVAKRMAEGIPGMMSLKSDNGEYSVSVHLKNDGTVTIGSMTISKVLSIGQIQELKAIADIKPVVVAKPPVVTHTRSDELFSGF